MTAYEQGFLTKCAEYGIPEQTARGMAKIAMGPMERHALIGSVGGAGLVGAALGGTVGALSSRKNRFRRALVGALIGGGLGGGAGYLRGRPVQLASAMLDRSFDKLHSTLSDAGRTYRTDPLRKARLESTVGRLAFEGLVNQEDSERQIDQFVKEVDENAARARVGLPLR